MELSAAAGSTQRITASLEDSPGGVEVAIEGSGFRPGTYRARLIVGDCSGTEEVRFQLAPLFAGEAGAVKGQALVPGVHLRDLVDSHAIVISDGASAGRLSCAPITMGN